LATLDPRVLELIETLMASGADWLIFELIEGINAGIVAEESQDTLALARIMARQDREVTRSPERIARSPQSRPLEGDEQIEWAARYVGTRLKDTLALMDVSAERLSLLVDQQVDGAYAKAGASVNLGLRDGEQMIASSPNQLSAAQSAVSDLLRGLDRWMREVTGGKATI
jgi:hypothetical protein